MIAAAWLMLSGLFCSLQLSTGSFPKPLTEEEERRYLKLASQGDIEARNVLIERNLRLVAHIMKKYYTPESDQEDLISIGTIGLIKGITTFDGSKGARLATYAARCVENAILTPTRISEQGGKNRTTGNRPSSGLFPVVGFGGFNDFFQKPELLFDSAAQILNLPDHRSGVDIRGTCFQRGFSLRGYGILYDDSDRCLFSHSPHPLYIRLFAAGCRYEADTGK